MAFDKCLLAAANQAAGTVHSGTKNSFLQAGDLGEWGPASEGEVAKAKSSVSGSNPEAGGLKRFRRGCSFAADGVLRAK